MGAAPPVREPVRPQRAERAPRDCHEREGHRRHDSRLWSRRRGGASARVRPRGDPRRPRVLDRPVLLGSSQRSEGGLRRGYAEGARAVRSRSRQSHARRSRDSDQPPRQPVEDTRLLCSPRDFARSDVALEWAININLRRIRMSDTSQIALIRKLDDARGNVNSFKSLLADDLEYDIAEGFPNGG